MGIIRKLVSFIKSWRENLRAQVSKYLVTRQVEKVLSLTHAAELAITPRNEWALVRSKQIEEIKAVRSGQQFDIVDRRSWCYSDDTEVLTKNGWKPWPAVVETDKLAIQTEDGHMAFSVPEHLVRFRYKGEMLHFKTKGTDQLITPEHRMYGRRKKTHKFDEEPHFYLAKKIAKLKRGSMNGVCRFKVPVSCLPVEVEDINELHSKVLIETQDTSEYDHSSKSYVVDLKDWVAFLGIYVAEGSRGGAYIGSIQASACPIPLQDQVLYARKHKLREKSGYRGHGVVICQNRTSRYWQDIADLLTRMGFNWNYKDNVGFCIHSAAVWDACKCAGWSSYEKKVPRWIKNLPVEYLETFIEWAMKGDGCRTKRGHKRYKTVSKRLADDMQELFARIGIAAYIIPEKNIVSSTGRRQADIYHIYEMHRKEVGIELHSEIKYDGYVYCAKVPGGLLYTRRNGKPVWSGNSYPYLPEALHRLNQPVPKNTPYSLRRFSETPIPRRAMNLVKNSVLSFKWQIKPTKEFVDDEDPDREKRIKIATETWKRPNNVGESDRDFLEQMIEDFLLNGAGCAEHRATPYAKRPTKFWAVDSSTVRIFLDWTESTPDRPRYAQMTGLKGERGIVTFLSDELMYIRDNIRTATPFGLGRLEVAFNSVNAFLGVQDMSARAGADQVHKTWLWWEQTLNTAHVQQIRRHVQNELEGQAKLSLIAGVAQPKVVEVTPVTPEDLLIDWQKFLIEIIAAAFDLSPQALNMDDHPAKATAQVMADSDWKNAVVPVATRFQTAITRQWLHDDLGWKDIEFEFIGLDDPDLITRTVIDQRLYQMNSKIPNEIRKANNLPPLPGPWGKLTMGQMQLVTMQAQAMVMGKVSGSPGGSSGSSMGGGSSQGGMGSGSTGSAGSLGTGIGTGSSMGFSADDITQMQPDEIQLYQELGILPDTNTLGQQMDQQSPGIMDQLTDELTEFFNKEKTDKLATEVQPDPVTAKDEAMQLERFYGDQHQESLAEKVINRRGVFGPSVNQQVTKNPVRGKYPRSGQGFFTDSRGKERTSKKPVKGNKPLKTGKTKKNYDPGDNNPYAQ